MRRRVLLILGLLVLAFLPAALIVAWPRINFFMLTGRFFPVKIVETLNSPVAVNGWGADGLHLADGRIVQLPGLRALPAESAALTKVTKRGVEIGADGRIYGLVRIHHWCGNDPVLEHIAKVDIADMMTFLRVGEPVVPVPESVYQPHKAGGTFTEWGWEIEQFLVFREWQKERALARSAGNHADSHAPPSR